MEPLGDKHHLVTFLWRGGTETRNVLVWLSDFGGVRPRDYLMRRLEQSDVWFLTVRLPRAARFLYWLSPNDPLDDAYLGQVGGRVLDPLNLTPFFTIGSTATLPGAPAQPWIVRNPEAAYGRVSGAHTISSALLRGNRRLWVYTPAGYSGGGPPSNLIVLLDGRMYVDVLLAPTTIDNLIATRQVGSTVAVFVENPPMRRNEELFGNETFADFLATELVPWVRRQFNVTSDARRVVIGGASAGGVGATYAALRHPDVFGNVLSQSAGFGLSPERRQEFDERAPGGDKDDHVVEEIEDRSVTGGAGWLASLVISSPKRSTRFYLDVGVFEADLLGGGLGALEPNRHIRDVLRAKGYEVTYHEFVGGHDYVNWRGTFADGVMALLRGK